MQRDDLIPVIVGVTLMIVLHVFFVAAWDAVYAQHPWTGYGKAMSTDSVAPHFSNSPVALLTAAVAIAVLGLIVPWTFRNVVRAGTMCGIGLTATGVILAFAFREIRESNLLPLGLVALALEILVPFLVGVSIGIATKSVRRRIGQSDAG